MKTAALSLIACLAASASFAGHPYLERAQPQDSYSEQLFGDREFSIDLFGSYTDARHDGDHVKASRDHVNFTNKGQREYRDGFGGGLGLNYFFTRYIGLGTDVNWWGGGQDNTVIHALSGSVIARFPIESARLAPYIYGGGGANFDGERIGTGHAGGGVDFRINRNVGIFSDGRYIFTGKSANDAATFRLGMRFAF